jgi:hypothetical protein
MDEAFGFIHISQVIDIGSHSWSWRLERKALKGCAESGDRVDVDAGWITVVRPSNSKGSYLSSSAVCVLLILSPWNTFNGAIDPVVKSRFRSLVIEIIINHAGILWIWSLVLSKIFWHLRPMVLTPCISAITAFIKLDFIHATVLVKTIRRNYISPLVIGWSIYSHRVYDISCILV